MKTMLSPQKCAGLPEDGKGGLLALVSTDTFRNGSTILSHEGCNAWVEGLASPGVSVTCADDIPIPDLRFVQTNNDICAEWPDGLPFGRAIGACEVCVRMRRRFLTTSRIAA